MSYILFNPSRSGSSLHLHGDDVKGRKLNIIIPYRSNVHTCMYVHTYTGILGSFSSVVKVKGEEGDV